MAAKLKSYQLGSDLVQFRAPFFGGSVNFYAIWNETGFDLVDAGSRAPGLTADFAAEMVRYDSRGISAIQRIFLTHTHIDHIGLAAWLQQETGAPVYATPVENEFMWERHGHTLQDLQGWLEQHGTPTEEADELAAVFPVVDDPLPAITALPPVVRIGGQAWQVLDTPGHSVAHVCLYDPAGRRLLSGDHLFAGGPPNVGAFPGSRGVPLADFLVSLDRLRSLDVAHVLPGHGQPFHHFADSLKQARAVMQERQEAALSAVQNGSWNAYQVARRMFPDLTRGVPGFTSVARASAHLQLLAQKGLVTAGDCIWVPA